MRAVFIFNLAQWEIYNRFRALGDEVLSADVDVLAAARQCRISAQDLSSFLSVQEMEEERNTALRLCDLLGEALAESMPERLRPLSRHLSHELLFPLGHFFLIKSMADRALEKFQPSSALAFAENQNVFFWDPPFIPPDLANAAVQFALQSRGIAWERLTCQSSDPSPSDRPSDQQHIWLPAFKSPLKPATTVAVGQGIWWSEMDALLHSASAPRTPLIAVSMAWINYVFPRRELPDVETMSLVNRVVRMVAERAPAYRAVLDSPAMQSLFSAWSGVIEVSIRYYNFGRLICDALGPSVVIHGCDIRAPQRCFAQAVLECGATPVSILHGGINGMDYIGIRHRNAIGHLAVWSERDMLTLAPYRDANFEIRAIGSMRSDIDRLLIASREEPQSARLRSTAKPCVVFLTCRIPCLYWFTTDISRHVETWGEICNLFLRRTDWEGIIKKHPRYDHQRLYCEDALPGNLRVESVSLDAALAAADAVVMVNVKTTAALDAIGRGVPVIHLNTALRGEPDRWVRDSGVRALHSVEELESELDRIFSDRDYAIACTQAQRSKLGEFIAATGEDAVCRLERWIEKLGANQQSRPHNPSALFRLTFAQWLDRLFLSDPAAPPPARPRCPLPHEPLLASHLLNRLTWYPWPSSTFPRARALWRAYLHMPREWNPTLRTFRRYVIECLYQDANNPSRSAVARALSRVIAHLLAPFGRG